MFGKKKSATPPFTYEDIELGDVVRDTITCYVGVVVAYTTWLNKCRRITVQSRELKDGKPIEACAFDIEQLEIVEKGTQPDKPFTGGARADTGARPTVPNR